MVTVYTFGDSILDCGHYNAYGVHPAGLLVKNDDRLFPGFAGKDLSHRGPVKLEHRAVDGARVDGLARQVRGLKPDPDAVALLTIGGNDLLGGLARDDGPGVDRFRATLSKWLDELPIERVLVGNVYDPTFGDDALNFLGIDPTLARRNHRRVNDVLAELGRQHGALVDVHAHFLTGDPSWYTHVIEPSLVGASELRRIFLAHFP